MAPFERYNDPQKKFIPIEELSAEHVDPAYEMQVPPTPEDIVLGHESDESEDWHQWFEEESARGPEVEYNDAYSRMSIEDDFHYWAWLDSMTPDFDELPDTQEDFADFVDKYDLPETATRAQMESLVARARKSYSARHSENAEIAKDTRRLKRGRGLKPDHKDHGGRDTLRRSEDETLH